jgi:DNA replicative helicase MCM subunit Mcm2 (Cdc46/Mcm family)
VAPCSNMYHVVAQTETVRSPELVLSFLRTCCVHVQFGVAMIMAHGIDNAMQGGEEGPGQQAGQQQGWPIAALTEYIKWTKKFQPVLSTAAEAVLLAYYQQLRNSAERSASRTTIRMLESLVRIAQVCC